MNKKQRTQSTVGLIAAILGAILLLMSVLSEVAAKMTALFPVFLIAGTAFTLFACIFMLCLSDKENGKAYRFVMILFVIHTALICPLCLVEAPLVTQILHAVADGAAFAFLLALCFAVLGKRNVLFPLIGFAVCAGLFFVIPLIPAILLMAAAVALLIASIIGYRKNADLCFWGILAAAVILVISVISMVRGDVMVSTHYLHVTLAVTAICAVTACPFPVIPVPVREVPEEEKEEKEPEMDKAIAEISLPIEKWIIKKYQGLSAKELLDAPVDALKGLSAGDAELLKDAFGIKTIGDLAKNKFFGWAEEIVAESLKK